jgi:16S rRNA (guanine527-N7)-methyltransferase
MDLSNQQIIKLLERYDFSPNSKTCEHIRSYISLLTRWNRSISLTTITSPLDIIKFHFGESIYGVTTNAVGIGRLADVGSGAGFPGIPISLASPETQVTLIEPNLKKSVFLSEVKRELNLASLTVIRDRMQEVKGSFDYITLRALGQMADFLQFARKHLAPAGRIVLWIGESEVSKLAREQEHWSWSEPIPIPDSERRYILVGSPDQ